MLTLSAAGNLGADAEFRHTPNGSPVLNFNLAVSVYDPNARENRGTQWLRVAVWGKRAEALARCSLTKGNRVAVSGQMSVREYTTRDGRHGVSVELNAATLTLLGGGQQQQGGSRAPAIEPPRDLPEMAEPPEDDIPF
jgi:single-strand DNA-binding protein